MSLLAHISRGWTYTLYNLGLYAYKTAVSAASLRTHKARLMRRGHKAVWDYLDRHIIPGEKYVWIHTASLGEFEQGRPLMERLRTDRPDLKILLTFFSPSGYEVRHSWPGADAVCYLPFDLPRNANRFLDKVQPVAAVFVKYEFWRNYLRGLHRRQTPVFLISGIFRKNQIFFKRGGAWYRNLLHYFTTLMVQDDNSRKLLASIGITNVSVCGDTRFDRVRDILTAQRVLPVLEEFSSNAASIFTAGSSWPADEAIYISWLQQHTEIKAVIAPHEFNAERVRHLAESFPGEAVCWTEIENNPHAAASARILIMNCFGLLSAAYRYASMAYVGGGFGAGLHNINEAAVYGIPVIFGPNNAKFIEARELQQCGGGREVTSAEEFSRAATELLNPDTRHKAGQAASAYIQSKLGATDKVFNIIAATLPQSGLHD